MAAPQRCPGRSDRPASWSSPYTPANLKTGRASVRSRRQSRHLDTGGISIKPADGMEKMKYDMAGGATMLASCALSRALKPSVKVILRRSSTENMPGGKAQSRRHSDRHVRQDYRSPEHRRRRPPHPRRRHSLRQTSSAPRHLVDAATLTGAIVVAARQRQRRRLRLRPALHR